MISGVLCPFLTYNLNNLKGMNVRLAGGLCWGQLSIDEISGYNFSSATGRMGAEAML
jgi:hypothetical protein